MNAWGTSGENFVGETILGTIGDLDPRTIYPSQDFLTSPHLFGYKEGLLGVTQGQGGGSPSGFCF